MTDGDNVAKSVADSDQLNWRLVARQSAHVDEAIEVPEEHLASLVARDGHRERGRDRDGGDGRRMSDENGFFAKINFVLKKIF